MLIAAEFFFVVKAPGPVVKENPDIRPDGISRSKLEAERKLHNEYVKKKEMEEAREKLKKKEEDAKLVREKYAREKAEKLKQKGQPVGGSAQEQSHAPPGNPPPLSVLFCLVVSISFLLFLFLPLYFAWVLFISFLLRSSLFCLGFVIYAALEVVTAAKSGNAGAEVAIQVRIPNRSAVVVKGEKQKTTNSSLFLFFFIYFSPPPPP